MMIPLGSCMDHAWNVKSAERPARVVVVRLENVSISPSAALMTTLLPTFVAASVIAAKLANSDVDSKIVSAVAPLVYWWKSVIVSEPKIDVNTKVSLAPAGEGVVGDAGEGLVGCAKTDDRVRAVVGVEDLLLRRAARFSST